jgi:hypothetical protein
MEQPKTLSGRFALAHEQRLKAEAKLTALVHCPTPGYIDLLDTLAAVDMALIPGLVDAVTNITEDNPHLIFDAFKEAVLAYQFATAEDFKVEGEKWQRRLIEKFGK